MNLCSKSQTKLYGLDEELNEIMNLYNNSKLPNKILLSGEKGNGKCSVTLYKTLNKDQGDVLNCVERSSNKHKVA